jgi:protein SCO1
MSGRRAAVSASAMALALLAVVGCTPVQTAPPVAPAHASPAPAVSPEEFDRKQSAILTDVEWEDEAGKAVRLSDFRDGSVVMTMLYTSCRKICPTFTIEKLHEVERSLAAHQKHAEVVVVTFDPDNDTSAVLAAFKKRTGFDRPNVHMLRGGIAQTRRLARAMGLGDFWRDEDHVVHGFGIVMLDASTKQARGLDWEHRDVAALLGQ